MRRYKRSQRVSTLIQEILAQLISHEVKDPGVSSVVLTRIELGDDLHLARVYYHTLGGQLDDAQKGLERAKGFLRRELGQRLDMKFVPDLRFLYDKDLDSMERIEAVLKGIRDEEPI